eukprot:3459680-Pleurochrysis_carterae.AAC.1
MGRKERLGLNPADAHRKEQKKQEYKKLLKQRQEKKEAKLNSDPQELEAEAARLRELNNMREAGGARVAHISIACWLLVTGSSRMRKRIEELEEMKSEALRRRAAREEEQAKLRPPGYIPSKPKEVSVDMSAITGIKRSRQQAAAASAPASSTATAGNSATRPTLPPSKSVESPGQQAARERAELVTMATETKTQSYPYAAPTQPSALQARQGSAVAANTDLPPGIVLPHAPHFAPGPPPGAPPGPPLPPPA